MGLETEDNEQTKPFNFYFTSFIHSFIHSSSQPASHLSSQPASQPVSFHSPLPSSHLLSQTNNHTAIQAIRNYYYYTQFYTFVSVFSNASSPNLLKICAWSSFSNTNVYFVSSFISTCTYPSLSFSIPTAHSPFRPTFPSNTLVIESTAIVCLPLTLPLLTHINSFNREYTAIFPASNAAFGNIHFNLHGYTPRIVIYPSLLRSFRLLPQAK